MNFENSKKLTKDNICYLLTLVKYTVEEVIKTDHNKLINDIDQSHIDAGVVGHAISYLQDSVKQ